MENPDSSKSEAFDPAAFASWLQIAGPIHDARRGGLVLTECTGSVQPNIVSAFFTAVRYNRFFHQSYELKPVLLFPAGPNGSALHSAVINGIKANLTAEKADPLIVHVAPYLCDLRQCVNNEAENLLAFLKKLRAGSICGVASAHVFRSSRINTPGSGSIISDQALALPHIVLLLKEIAIIARKKRLAVYLFTEPTSLSRRGAQPVDTWIVTTGNDSSRIDHAAFDRLFHQYESGGWTQVHKSPDYDAQSDTEIALRISEAYIRKKNPRKGWDAIKHLDPSAFGAKLEPKQHMANIAIAAGEIKDASRILKAIDVSELPSTPERLHTLSASAYKAGVEDLGKAAGAELIRRFPSHRFAREAIYTSLFNQRKFDDAYLHAKKNKLILEAAHAKAFQSPRTHLKRFIILAKAHRMEAEALASCAEEAEYRGYPCRAARLAAEVPNDHPMASRMRLLRCRIVAKHYRFGRRFMRTELTSLMRYSANNPKDELRGHIEFLFRHGLEEPLAQLTLTTLLMDTNRRDAVKATIKQTRSLAEKRKIGTNDRYANLEAFLEAVVATPVRIIMGEGNLPPDTEKLVDARLIYDLGKSILSDEAKENPDYCLVMLHYLSLLCRDTGDPSTDVVVAQSLIEFYATCGMAQEARILGEEILHQLPKLHSKHITWRRSNCWQALAEASTRSGHSMLGALQLCLAALAHDGPSYEVELLRRRLRLLARIFRNFEMPLLAEHFASTEERLLHKAGLSNDPMHRLDVFRFQLKVQRISGDRSQILALIQEAEKLLAVNLDSEFMVLLSMQVSLFRLLPINKRDPDLAAALEQRTNRLNEPLRSLLWGAINPDINRQDVLLILGRLSDAEDRRDLAFHIQPALPALMNALERAVEKNDADLFISASTGFSHPALSAQSTSSPSFRNASLVRTTLEGDTDKPPVEATTRLSFSRTGEISAEQIRNSLKDGEAVVIISGEPARTPYLILITQSRVEPPRLMDDWSSESFSRWRKQYHNTLRWKKPKNYLPGIDVISPPRSELEDFFRGLSLKAPSNCTLLTIIPPAHLFGFTWNLGLNGNQFLCETHRVAISPSLSFVVERSEIKENRQQKRIAWMGSKDSPDETLSLLRSVTENCLLGNNFTISETDAPDECADSDLVFIGAHGGTGLGNFFRSVGDRLNEFPPIEIARRLRGSKCVILAVCSGGKSDRQSGSEETLGLVTELFRFGVRCVIAPPWPIDVSVIQFWLPGFLQRIEAGEMIFDAIDGGNERLRSNINHPCAWGQLHIYGDATLKLVLPVFVWVRAKERLREEGV